MKKQLSTLLTMFVLTILAWSCFGLNIGMIGHEIMGQVGAAEHQMGAHHHDCCIGSATTQETTGTTAISIDHHNIPAILTFVVLILFVGYIAQTYALLQKVSISYKDTRVTLYVRQRWREICHVVYVYRQLFSQGIIHTKTY